jgi:hypothetical protein
MTQHAIQELDNYSRAANPADPIAVVGSEETLKRDSSSNIWNWKSRLEPEKIEQTRECARDIWPHFYSDEDW